MDLAPPRLAEQNRMLATKLTEVAEQQNERNESNTFCTTRLCAVIVFPIPNVGNNLTTSGRLRYWAPKPHTHTHTERVQDKHIYRVNYELKIQMLCKCQSLIKEVYFKSIGQKNSYKILPVNTTQLLDINNSKQGLLLKECKESSYIYIYIYYRPT